MVAGDVAGMDTFIIKEKETHSSTLKEWLVPPHFNVFDMNIIIMSCLLEEEEKKTTTPQHILMQNVNVSIGLLNGENKNENINWTQQIGVRR